MAEPLSKHRIEALSDGIFAVAMTLLVLDIKVPLNVPSGTLWQAIAAQDRRVAFSFLITFLLASIFWTFQHKLFDLMHGMSHATLAPTFVFLFLVSVLPFSTSVFGHHIAERSAFVLYFANQALMAIALVVKLQVAQAQGLLRPGLEAAMLRMRLGFLSIVMSSGMLAAGLLPLRFVWAVPLALSLVGRQLRNVLGRRYEAKYAPLSPPAIS